MTDDIKRLLNHRAAAKKHKPSFYRQEYHKRKRLQKVRWRRPRGMHSKMKRRETSKGIWVKVGYSSPKKVRGLHKSGRKLISVFNIKDIKSVREDQLAVIAHTIGQKKKVEMAKLAKQQGIEVYNLDVDAYLKSVEKKIEEIKEARKKKAEKKDKKGKRKAEEKKTNESIKKEEKPLTSEVKQPEIKEEQKIERVKDKEGVDKKPEDKK